MAKALSNDLRVRLIGAIETQGMSCHAAAERFGVAPSTAVKLMQHWRQSGASEPRPQGGDRRSERIEAYSSEILSLIAGARDITLAEIASHLLKAHGERFAPSTIWRCLDRHGQTFKKNSSRERARTPGRGRSAGRVAGRAA